MKRNENSAKTTKNFDLVISKLSENEVLNVEALSFIKGGVGVGDGGADIPIIPPPPIA